MPARSSIPVIAVQPPAPRRSTLTDDMKRGLDAPICLTWELTYACNLACTHCLSSSGRRDPRELSTQECFAVIDELERLKVFYVNIGGGEPMIRKDFFEILDYANEHHVGVSSRRTQLHHRRERRRLASMDYLDIRSRSTVPMPTSTTRSVARVRSLRPARRWSIFGPRSSARSRSASW